MFIDWQTKFIGEAREQRKPFFLYMPFVGAHFPLMAPAEDVAKFKGRYMRGWEAVRRERFERSEEHTSELQSLMRISYAVFCLQKKKNSKPKKTCKNYNEY